MNLLLTEAALRVLTAYTSHRYPDSSDAKLLYDNALPEDDGQSLEELACRTIRREISQSRRARTAHSQL